MSEYEITLQIGPKNLTVTLDITSSFKDITEFLVDESLIPSHVLVAYYGVNSKKLSEDQSQVLSTIICIQNESVKVLTGVEIEQFKLQQSTLKSQGSGSSPCQYQVTIPPQVNQQYQQPNNFIQSPQTQYSQIQKIALKIEVQDGAQSSKFVLQIDPENKTLNDVANAILYLIGISMENVAYIDLYIQNQQYNNADKRCKTLKQLFINDQTTIHARVIWLNNFIQSPQTQQSQIQKIALNIEVQDGAQSSKFVLQIDPENKTLNDVANVILYLIGISMENVAYIDLYISNQPYNCVDTRCKALNQLFIKDQTTIHARVVWGGWLNNFIQSPQFQQSQIQKIALNIEVLDGAQSSKFVLQVDPENKTLNNVEQAILQQRGIYLENVAVIDLYIQNQQYNTADKRSKTLKQLFIKDQTTINARFRWTGGNDC